MAASLNTFGSQKKRQRLVRWRHERLDCRELEVDFFFLPEGNFTMDAYQDGVNADRMASDYKKVESAGQQGHQAQDKLAPGGGWAARIHP